MICPRCEIEMVRGRAIADGGIDTSGCFFAPVVNNAKTMKLIDCWKCPQCGHSDDGPIRKA